MSVFVDLVAFRTRVLFYIISIFYYIYHGGNANNNCCRPGTGTTGLEADEEEETQSSSQAQPASQAKQPLIKIGVSTRGRGFGSRK
jgi:hypothetical protein